MSTKRFRIAFSFAGEKREFIAQVAALLALEFSRKKILYDKFHEAEFAQWKLGLNLPDLYRDESDLIVVVVCPDYSEKDWCGLEWVAIHGALMSGKNHEVMLCRFGHAQLQGLYENAGFIEHQDAALATLADLARRHPLLARTSEAERIALYTQTAGKPLLLRWVAGQLGRGRCRTFTRARLPAQLNIQS